MIIDFGCGEADFLDAATGFKKRVGVDFSEQALSNAKKNFPQLDFVYGDETKLNEFNKSADLVVSFGTLEHVDTPQATFDKLVDLMKDENSHLILSSPSFLNPRGIIWMTLVKLFNVPMSLSDKHFLSIADFKKMAATNGQVTMVAHSSSDFAVSYDDYFFIDMKKRLTNALRDAKMDNTNVDALLQWAHEVMPYLAKNEYSGIEGTYIFKKN